MNRRSLLTLLPAALLGPTLPLTILDGACAEGVTIDAILRDPETPVGGNPSGDLTLVAFLDYNCPYCKKSFPDLERLVRTDGRIRLVHKDWPMLGDASVYGAQIALAAKYQGRYEDVHRALMTIPGRKVPKERMREAVEASGVDLARLDKDRVDHESAIAALLQRNLDQANALGLEGTPVYLVGSLKVFGAIGYDNLKRAVAQARAAEPR